MRAEIKGPVTWLDGDPALIAEIDLQIANGLGRQEKLHHTPRRSVYKIARPALALKIHHARPGHRARAFREAIKRSFLYSSGRREWRALNQLHARGIPVPAPRAWGRLPCGDELVACDLIDGIPLIDCLPTADEMMQRALLHSLGESLSILYAQGFRHGDLHVGNLVVRPNAHNKKEEIILLDVQSATRSRREATRLTDLARLELSLLRAGFSASARAALREELEAGPDFYRAYARFLKDYVRGRARRVLAVGRRTAEVEIGALHGLRASRFPKDALVETLDCFHAQASKGTNEARRGGRVQIFEVKGDDKPLIIKQIKADSWRRALVDHFRGSPASRAFHKARAVALLEDRAATPLAFLEKRRFGLPLESWLILPRAGDQDLDSLRLPPGEPQIQLGGSLGRWLAEGHALGLSHRDAKANNIRVHQHEGEWKFTWVDVEDLTEPRLVTRADRVRIWSQIGASLSDTNFRLDARLAAFHAYADQIAYTDGDSGGDGELAVNAAATKKIRMEMIREIAIASVGRQHRWRGEDCSCLTESPP